MRRLSQACVALFCVPLFGQISGVTPMTPTLDQTIHPRYVATDGVGNIWFSDEHFTPHSIGYFDFAGHVHSFAVPCTKCNTGEEIVYIFGLAPASDGVWFNYAHAKSDGSGIDSGEGRVTASGTFTIFPLSTDGHRFFFNAFGHSSITAGPDGNIWFTENSGNKIGRITPSGTITEFPLSGFASPSGIIAGSDGNIWFTEASSNKIGKITPAGTITEFVLPAASSYPYDITAGSDGNLWATLTSKSSLLRITPSGSMTTVPLPTGHLAPTQIAALGDGRLWIGLRDSAEVGRADIAGASPSFEFCSLTQCVPQCSSAGSCSASFDETSRSADGKTEVYYSIAGAASNDLIAAFTAEAPKVCPPGTSFSMQLNLGGRFDIGVQLTAYASFTGGTPPITLSAVGLPPGLEVKGSSIAGTFTTSGTFDFTVTAEDANGCRASVSSHVVVRPAACAHFNVDFVGSHDLIVGAFNQARLEAEHGTPPFTYAVIGGSLPEGLTLNSTTGVISGIPVGRPCPVTETCYAEAVVRAVDANGCTSDLPVRFRYGADRRRSSRH